MAAKDGYQSLEGLTKVVLVMLWLDVVLQVAYAGASLGVVSLINALIDGSFIPEDDSLAPSEILQAVVGLASAVLPFSGSNRVGVQTLRSAGSCHRVWFVNDCCTTGVNKPGRVGCHKGLSACRLRWLLPCCRSTK